MPEPVLTQALITEAVTYLDLILEEHAVGYVHVERGDLIRRLDAIRTEATACRVILTERRSLHLE
jgi:hypothetical protein